MNPLSDRVDATAGSIPVQSFRPIISNGPVYVNKPGSEPDRKERGGPCAGIRHDALQGMWAESLRRQSLGRPATRARTRPTPDQSVYDPKFPTRSRSGRTLVPGPWWGRNRTPAGGRKGGGGWCCTACGHVMPGAERFFRFSSRHDSWEKEEEEEEKKEEEVEEDW